jgi:uncharacterized protein (TIGR03067 family)
MIRTLTLFLLAGSLVLTGCSHTKAAGTTNSQDASADQVASSTAEDHEKLQGTWKMDGAVLNGQRMMNDVRWVIDADHLTIVLKGNAQGGVRAEYELGTGDSPNTILIKLFNNPLADKGYAGGSYTGIYKLSGDKLRVCYDMTGRQYPKNFDAGKGSGWMSYEFTREKTEQHAGE